QARGPVACGFFLRFRPCRGSRVNRLLTLYLVFARTLIARYGEPLSSERLNRTQADQAAPAAAGRRRSRRRQGGADGATAGSLGGVFRVQRKARMRIGAAGPGNEEIPARPCYILGLRDENAH